MGTPLTHSPIGASSYERFSNCPGSVGLSQILGLTDIDTSNEYSAEGVVAHSIAEKCLTQINITNLEGDLVEQDGYEIEINSEMIDGAKLYAETILADKLRGSLKSKILVEQTVTMPELHPQISSTFDASFYDPEAKHLKVYDYKYGKNVQVDAKNNNQLLYYALLASKDLDVETVELVIIQPRAIYKDIPKIKRWSIKYKVVEQFKESLMKAIKRVDDSKAVIQSSLINHILNINPEELGLSNGTHCKYCKAEAECPARLAYLPSDADIEDKDNTVSQLGYEKLADIYAKSKGVRAYLDAVETRLLYLVSEEKINIENVKPVFKAKRASWVKDKLKKKLLHTYINDNIGEVAFNLKTVKQIKQLSKNPKELDPFIEPMVNEVILALADDKREDVRNLSKQ